MDESASSEQLAAAGDGAQAELARRLALQAAGADLKDDPLSAMLAVQMAAVHEAALRMLRRAKDRADEPETAALYARQGARLLHLFQRQAKTMARRRETALLEARAAEFARREAEATEETRRRRELQERIWDPDWHPDDEDDGMEADGCGEDGIAEAEIAEDNIADDAIGGRDAAPRPAAAADRRPAARAEAGQPDPAETCERLAALFARAAAERRAEAAAEGDGKVGDAGKNRQAFNGTEPRE